MNKKLFLLACLSLTASIFCANNYIYIKNASRHEVEATVFDTKNEEGDHIIIRIGEIKRMNLKDACATKLSVKRGPGVMSVNNGPLKTVLKINKNECRTRLFNINESVNGLTITEGSKAEVSSIEKMSKFPFSK